MPDNAYGQILVTVHDYRTIDRMINRLRGTLIDRLPDHYELISQLRARAQARAGQEFPGIRFPTAQRATVPLPGETMRSQIRFSPGALAEAHIL